MSTLLYVQNVVLLVFGAFLRYIRYSKIRKGHRIRRATFHRTIQCAESDWTTPSLSRKVSFPGVVRSAWRRHDGVVPMSQNKGKIAGKLDRNIGRPTKLSPPVSASEPTTLR